MEKDLRSASKKGLSVVGKNLPRVDGFAKATGEAKYTVDLELPGMLCGKILRSPYPHARILRIDTSKAERLPGVMGVVTGKDTTGIGYGHLDGLPPDEHPLALNKVRYLGEEVAAVAAVSEDIAEEALNLIKVDYEELPAVFDPEEALKEGAPQIHTEIIPPSNLVCEAWGLPSPPPPHKVVNNVCATYSVGHGDVLKGFKESDYIREDRFVIPATAHCAMEPHVALANFDSSGKLQVWLSHQGYEMKRQWLAQALGLPPGRVRVLKAYVGGAFGGKTSLFSYEFLAAFLSRKTGRPVKITLSREEVFFSTRLDHRMVIDLKTGVKKDGTLVAQQVKILDDTGAFRGTALILLRLCYSKTIPVYRIPNVKLDGIAAYTNKPTCGPKRGHGTPQMLFAIESQLDMIAEELGIDALELRLKNARKQGETLPNGDRLESCGLSECIRKAAQASRWSEKRGKGKARGIGIGVGSVFSGTAIYPYGSAATVMLNPDGTVTLFTGAVEMGQGSDTVMVQIAAEEMGVSPQDVNLVSADSELCPTDLGNFIMGGVHISGEAVRRAAADAKGKLLERAAKARDLAVERLEVRDGGIYLRGNPERVASIPEVLHVTNKEVAIIGEGYCKAVAEGVGGFVTAHGGHLSNAYSFTAGVAEVEVDKETGKVEVLRLTVANDGGVPINPLCVAGQQDGQAVMAQGDLFLEEILEKEGQILNPSFTHYRIPGAMDSAPVKSIDVETFDPKGPFGAKEAGETARSPLIPAIANAIYDATGVRIKELPLSPDKVLKALGK